MASETRLTSKGQIVLPKELRDRLKWHPGLRLRVIETEGGVVLKPLADDFENLLDELQGCMKGGDPISALEAEHRGEIED